MFEGNMATGRMHARLRVIAAAVLSAFAVSASAGDEDLYFSELPIVASVSRLPQRLADAPGAVTVIDRTLIKASGARNFVDLLRLVPGFQVTPHNQEGGIVAYHGLSNEEYTPRVQVLLDGRSLYSPLFKSGVNWNLIPVALENIERIEVMRGANGVSYGSNALLGVINIITQDASQTHGWMLAANHGNNSVRDQTVRWGGRVSGADLRMTAKLTGDGGFQKMFDGSLGWFDPHDARHAGLFDLRADIPLGNHDELRVGLSHAEDVSQYGRPASLSDPFRDLAQHSTSLSLEWSRVIAPGEEFKLRYAHVDDWFSGAYDERVSFGVQSGQNVSFTNRNRAGGRSTVDELEFQYLLSPWHKTRLVWGGALKYVTLQSVDQFYLAPRQTRATERVFGNLEWNAGAAWLVNFGASIENDSIAGSFVDPRVSVSYRLQPDHTLRFIASRAHRTPSLYEANGSQRKLPDGGSSPVDITYLAQGVLRPERVDTLEVGYLGEWKSLRASLDVRAFREKIPNRIQIVPTALPASSADNRDSDKDRFFDRSILLGGIPYPYGRADAAMNLENVVVRGYEYQFRWQPFESTRLLYNHALIQTEAVLNDLAPIAEKFAENIDKIPAQTRRSAPRNSQSAMLIQQLPHDFDLSVMYYKSGLMQWLRNSYTNPYERIDWRLARSFKLAGVRAELAYTAQMANHDMEGRRNTRIAKELHWLSLRLDF
ncbi:TonB-dependent receptor [Dechloromonas sp. ZY10]|uniref:TonB-dependent receptor plug domain-containing protein n=1 Tax=Dechloromonas aquae TaxID=2664436 RepID=UPI0035289AB2